MNGCIGKCCESFPIGTESALELLNRLNCFPADDEYSKISFMLRVLQPNKPARYSCIHHDPKTKLCTNYGARPYMCSAYPSYNRGGDFCWYCFLSTEQLENRILL